MDSRLDLKRVLFIDNLKGFSILWVILYHMPHYEWIGYPLRMPLFFFCSGIFFKIVSLKEFVIKRINRLVIPFIFFSVLGYLYHTSIDIVVNRDIRVVLNHSVFNYLENNYPLWFIVVLLNIHILSFIILKVNKNKCFVLFISLAFFLFVNMFSYLEYPIRLDQTFKYLLYFILGVLYGKDLIQLIKGKRMILKILIYASLYILVLWIIRQYIGVSLISSMIFDISHVGGIIILFILFKSISQYVEMKVLNFYGKNSLIILGTHVIYLYMYLLLLSNLALPQTSFWGIIGTILTMFIIFPTVYYFKRYFPKFVGAKDFISEASNSSFYSSSSRIDT